jgi:hypothetical protein
MLQDDDRVRLTAEERRVLIVLTGDAPPDRWLSVHSLNGWIDLHLGLYPGRTAEELLLRQMLESFRPERQSSPANRSLASR